MSLVNPTDLKQLALTINGVPVTGASDDDFVVLAPNAGPYSYKVGGRGEYAPARTNDDGATITISIFEGATAVRQRLDEIVRLQKTQGLTSATYARISIKNPLTKEHITADKCWIDTEPERASGVEQSARVYVFRTDEYKVLG